LARGRRFGAFASQRIALDILTFRQSRHHRDVTGVIFLKLKGGEFPEPGSSDHLVILMEANRLLIA
jgi:hypothetical protein